MCLNMLRAPTSCLQLGETALHVAAKIGDLPIVKYLIQNGASTNLRNRVKHGFLGQGFLRCWILDLKVQIGKNANDSGCGLGLLLETELGMASFQHPRVNFDIGI